MAKRKNHEEDTWEKARRDPRTTEQLIKDAIEQWDWPEEQYVRLWPYSAKTVLCSRGDEESLVAIEKLCVSADTKDRAVGAYLLSEFGLPERTYPHECKRILLKMLKHETEVEVLGTIGNAFGHLHPLKEDKAVIGALLKLAAHPHEEVRFGAVFGLLWHEDETAIAALVKLSADADEDVRDWATFGIGSGIDIADHPERFDTPEVRQALLARIDDPHWPTQFEALDGLALRRNKQVVNHYASVLANKKPLGNENLCAALRELIDHYTGDPDTLKRALAYCDLRDAEDAEFDESHNNDSSESA